MEQKQLAFLVRAPAKAPAHALGPAKAPVHALGPAKAPALARTLAPSLLMPLALLIPIPSNPPRHGARRAYKRKSRSSAGTIVS